VKRCLFPCLLLLCWCLPQALDTARAAPSATSGTLTPTFTLMHEALQQALHLRFAAAFEAAMHLEQPTQRSLEAQLVRGIIAYFQARWQIHPAPTNRQSGQKVLAALLEAGQRQLARSPREPRLQLILGIGAVFHGLLQQQSGSSLDLALLTQGRTWLQQALMAQETMLDAHQALCDAAPANLSRFKDVLDYLKQDLHHETAAK